MINLTNAPAWLDSYNCSVEIACAISEASEYLVRRYPPSRTLTFESITSTHGGDATELFFLKLFKYAPGCNNRQFDESWIVNAFEFVVAAKQDLSSVDLSGLFDVSREHYRRSAYTAVRKGIWLTLVLLYGKGCISLPASFKALSVIDESLPGAQRTDFAFECYPELMNFVVSGRYKLCESEYWAGVDSKVRERVAQYGTRLFWVLGATKPEQINLDDVIKVHLHYIGSNDKLAAEIPTRTIMGFVCHRFGSRVGFTYEEFCRELDGKLLGARKNSQGLSDVSGELSSLDELYAEMQALVKRDYAPSRLGNFTPNDFGVEGVAASFEYWMVSQRRFIERRNYEREFGSVGGISAFNMYMFEFLPRWYASFEYEAGYSYPSSPAKLSSIFIAPAEAVNGAPPSFLTFLDRLFKQPVVSADTVHLQQLSYYFNWVERKYQEHEGYTGFRNPITALDKRKVAPSSESNARPFTRWQYSMALNYLGCIFCAIKLINQAILDGDLMLSDIQSFEQVALALGWNPKFYCGGREYTVSRIPRVFLERWTIPGDGAVLTVISTHYLVHILTAVDSGLRHQSVRWLCINFDRYLGEDYADNSAHKIYVSTDKVSQSPIESHVSTLTIEALRFHRDLRDLIDLPVFKQEIYYRGNEETRKGKFIPLFSRNVATGHPFNEVSYGEAYVKFLIEFQVFLNDFGADCKLFELKPDGYHYGDKIEGDIRVSTHYGVLYCPIRPVTDMTPHHTRSSTVRAWRRFMSAEDVGRYKTGHKSVAVVNYYDKVLEEDRVELSQRLNRDIDNVWAGESINASSPMSNFRKSIQLNPAKAMVDFGCITSAPVSGSEEVDGVALITRQHHSGLAHFSTHICTRNGVCTEEMKLEGLEDRCGMCIYAVKGVDNLPAIDVKINCLTVEVRDLHDYADSLCEKNQYELAKVDERLEVVVAELLGWIWSRDHLVVTAKNMKDYDDKFFSFRPEILERSMRQFNCDERSVEYVLSRLYLDSQFPYLISDVVRAKYRALQVALMGNQSGVFDIFNRAVDSTSEFVGQIKSMLDFQGMKVSELARELEAKLQCSQGYINTIGTVLVEDEE